MVHLRHLPPFVPAGSFGAISRTEGARSAERGGDASDDHLHWGLNQAM